MRRRLGIHKSISCAEGLAYLPVLERELRYLEASTAPGHCCSQSFVFSCGVRGRIQLGAGYRKLEIWQDPPAYISGMVHDGYLIDLAKIPPPPNIVAMPDAQGQYYYQPGGFEAIEVVTHPGEELATYLQSFYPSTEQAKRDDVDRQWECRLELAVDPPIKRLIDYGRFRPSQATSVQAGLYTGEMRKVVQLLLGTNTPIYYMSDWTRAHGIFTAPDGGKWLIELGIRGALAMKLKTCAVSEMLDKRLHDELGYMPEGEFFPVDIEKAIDDGDVIRLAPQSAFDDYYAKVPYYTGGGFAFSYSGHEAQNTCYAMEWHGPARYTVSYLYKVVIRVDEAGNPAAADLSVVSSGFLYNESAERWPHPKWPGAKGLRSQFMSAIGLDGYPTNKYPVACYGTPLYVFYVGDRAEVVTYTYVENTTSLDTVGPELVPEWNLPKYWGGYDSASSTYTNVLVNTLCGFSSSLGGVGRWLDAIVSTTSYSNEGCIGASLAGTPYPYTVRLINTEVGFRRATTAHGEIRQHSESFIVPSGDRECYYHCIGDYTEVQAHVVTESKIQMRGAEWATKDVISLNNTIYNCNISYRSRGDGPSYAVMSSTQLNYPEGPASFEYTDVFPSDPFWSTSWNTLKPVDASVQQNYTYGCFLNGELLPLTSRYSPGFYNWNNPFFRFIQQDGDQNMFVSISAFKDVPAWIIQRDINYVRGVDCLTSGDYPYAQVTVSNTFVGLP